MKLSVRQWTMFLLVLSQINTMETAGAELASHPLEQLLKVLYHLYRINPLSML